MADAAINEAETKKRRDFYADLEQHFRKKWNCSIKFPRINGRAVDLYRLYQQVVSMGGWSKVANWNRWDGVVEGLQLPAGCVGAEHAIKLIYMRYLAKYELMQTFGDTDNDDGDAAGGGSLLGMRPSRGRSYLSSLGAQAGSSNFSRFPSATLPDQSQYDRLLCSLKSGLPNEVDFAMNACLTMSSATINNQLLIKLHLFPVLIDLLLAHIGFFDESTCGFKRLFEEAWIAHTPDRKFVQLWCDLIEADDENVAELVGLTDASDTSVSSTVYSWFSIVPDTQRNDATALKRINQVANILRNFSFEIEFRGILASNRSLLRYLLGAINSRDAILQSLALDTLGNIASEMNLNDLEIPLLCLFFRTLSRCFNSDDKFHVIRALETISSLCANEQNASLLCDFLEPSILRRLIALLAVKDIMMCVYLLECLYQLTELGPLPCQRIVEQPKAIDAIVQFVTLEAVSFGPKGLSGMKVVEYGLPYPHAAMLPHPSKYAQHVNVAHKNPMIPSAPNVWMNNGNGPLIHGDWASSAVSPAGVMANIPHAAPAPPAPFLARPMRPTTPTLTSPTLGNSISRPLTPNQITVAKKPSSARSLAFTGSEGDAETPVTSNCSGDNDTSAYRGSAVVNVQQDQNVEQLTLTWLRQNCVADASSSVSRGELYTNYVQDMRRLHDSSAVFVTAFTNMIRQIFPSCTIRHLEGANCRGSLLQFDGLKMSKTSNNTSPVVSQHPLMQQILSVSSAPLDKTTSQSSPSVGSPLSTAAASRLLPTVRTRSDSVGTVDSGYSLPGTPDSISSTFSGTNSSTGMSLNVNFCSQMQQPTPVSPHVPPATIKSPKSSPQKNSTLLTTCFNNGNGLVNGMVMNCNSQTPVCQLEVCHPAQEARSVIETGDTHEARIVRVENTVAAVSSQFFQPSTEPSTMDGHASSPCPSPAQLNGSSCIMGDSSPENSCSSASAYSKSTADDSLSPKSKKTKQKQKADLKKRDGAQMNGVIKPFNDQISTSPGENSIVSRFSPSPEAVKQNVDFCQQSIQQLLFPDGGDDAKLATTIPTDTSTTVNETLPKKSPKKRKHDSNGIDSSIELETTEKSPSPKKKKLSKTLNSPFVESDQITVATTTATATSPVVMKMSATAASTMVSLDEVASPQPKNWPISPGNAPFRPPFPPAVTQNTQVVVGSSVAPSAASTAQQVVIRLPPPNGRLKLVCEWDGCGKGFDSANAVYYHVSKCHINDETCHCKWPHCDQTPRLRWSLVSHVQDVHCNEHILRAAAHRRYEISMCGFSKIPEPRSPPPHPGYPPDAAMSAIRRHSLVNLPKEIIDETEGPVTRSIRVTGSLILRNLVKYSADARRTLLRYESLLAYLAFSRLESSSTLAQCLAELNRSATSAKPTQIC